MIFRCCFFEQFWINSKLWVTLLQVISARRRFRSLSNVTFFPHHRCFEKICGRKSKCWHLNFERYFSNFKNRVGLRVLVLNVTGKHCTFKLVCLIYFKFFCLSNIWALYIQSHFFNFTQSLMSHNLTKFLMNWFQNITYYWSTVVSID